MSPPRDPTVWHGPLGDKYARRFFWTPAQVDKHWLTHYSQFPRTQVIREMVGPVVPKNAAVLEVGCSCGNQLQMLHDLGYSGLSGIDINKVAISLLTTRRPWCKGQVAPATKLPFPDKSFDLVMTCWCLAHLPPEEYPKALAEIKRVSRRWAFISEPFSQKEVEFHKNYIWSRNFGADIGGKLLSHRMLKAVHKGTVTTGCFLVDLVTDLDAS